MKKILSLTLIAVLGLFVFSSCQTQPPVKRFGSVIGLKKSEVTEYNKLHADAWPEVPSLLKESNIQNYSIYLTKMDDNKNYLFSYLEYQGTDMEGDFKKLADHPTIKKWWTLTDPMQTPLKNRAKGEKWKNMDEVFHMD